MAFAFKKILDHGASNRIVARLSLQIFKILENCNLAKETHDKIAEQYLTLQKRLLRCWEIKERFRQEFNAAVEAYKPPQPGEPVQLPQIARLDEECQNFLYEAKNYIRGLLQVVNLLYGTDFKEA